MIVINTKLPIGKVVSVIRIDPPFLRQKFEAKVIDQRGASVDHMFNVGSLHYGVTEEEAINRAVEAFITQ
jgi:hypothetical protein